MSLDEAIAQVNRTSAALSSADALNESALEEVFASEARLATAKEQQAGAGLKVTSATSEYNASLDALSAAALAAKRPTSTLAKVA